MDGHAIRKGEIKRIKSSSDSPFNETVQEIQLSQVAGADSRKFGVRCDAGNAGRLEVGSDSVSIRIEQRIRNEGKDELWGSLLVECKEQDDGSLAVEVVAFHPNWDEPLRIASIQSNPCDKTSPEPTLRCDFEQKHL